LREIDPNARFSRPAITAATAAAGFPTRYAAGPRQFRQLLHQYNAALSFISLNCNVMDRDIRAGVNCFKIHGVFDPAYTTEARLRANTQLDGAFL
jgi:hypothetical protein